MSEKLYYEEIVYIPPRNSSTEIQGRVHGVFSFLHTFPCIIDI